MITIMGYERKTGEFTPLNGSSIQYDNVTFHLLNDSCGIAGFVGSSCEQMKVKVKDLPVVFGVDYSGLRKFINAPVQLDYSLISGKPTLSRVTILDSKEDFVFTGGDK